MKHPVVAYFERHPEEMPYKFAKRAGMGYQTLYNIINRHQSNYMRPDTMLRLVEGSNGEITMAALMRWNEEWLTQEAARRQKPTKPKPRSTSSSASPAAKRAG